MARSHRSEEVDSLFTVPPKEFVAARNAVADKLKKAGEKDAAAEVRALQRPTVSIWAANQVARKSRDDVKALIEASAKLRKAQLHPGAHDLRALTEEHRAVVKRLRAELAKVLELSPTERHANLDRAEATLTAAASGSKEQQSQLEEGTLTEELGASGFDVFAGAQVAPPAHKPAAPSAPEKTKPKAAHAKDQDRDEAAARREEERARAQAAAVAEAEAEADARSREHAAAVEAVTKAQATRDAAHDAVEAAKTQLHQAEIELRRVQTEEKSAAAKAHAAAKKLAAIRPG